MKSVSFMYYTLLVLPDDRMNKKYKTITFIATDISPLTDDLNSLIFSVINPVQKFTKFSLVIAILTTML